MRAHRRLVAFLTSCLIAYALASVLLMAAPALFPGLVPEEDAEPFPFFSWAMFDMVPGTSDSFSILIHDCRGKRYAPALDVLALPELMEESSRRRVSELVDGLGFNLRNGLRENANAQRRALESELLAAPCRYELLRRRYDPLARWKGHEPAAESLALFESGQ